MMKPMLASPVKGEIKFPCVISPKIDGLRCIIKNGVALSRSLKPIPNKYIQSVLGWPKYNGLDGELVVGSPTDPNCMQNTTSGVMSYEGEPDFKYFVFDRWDNPDVPWIERVQCFYSVILPPNTSILEWVEATNQQEVDKIEHYYLNQGYEGVMIRDPKAPYKYGRSTSKEGYLLKLKRFSDYEATITGFIELLHNANEAKVNALGNTERSSHKDNKVGMNTLGALCVKDLTTGVEFDVGTGFTQEQRQEIWDNKEQYIGKLITYKCFENGGVKDKPRFPVFKCFRSERDM